ncbi:MAG: hypothetical protein H7296_06820 [Bacteroidia bacterium]|nr:hypothetical protein [Bacteroidia bacterium]
MSSYTLSNFRGLPTTPVEDLTTLMFENTDVLTHDDDVRVRNANIDKAIALANSLENTTTIIIKSTSGLHKIKVIVTGHNNGYVYTIDHLKIPVKIIYSVDFYT